jgi:tetratricopeptide (TPR) repeat protein
VARQQLRPIKGSSSLAIPEPPLTGRNTEYQELTRIAKKSLKNETARLVALVGEAGLGKSRLLDLVANSLSQLPTPPAVFHVHCRESAEDSFDPVRRLMHLRLGYEPERELAELQDKLLSTISEALHELDAAAATEIAHLLGHFAGIPFPDSPVLHSLEEDPQRFQERIHGAIERFIEADVRKGGLVWLIDDAHHLGKEAALLVSSLLAQIPNCPFLVVVAGQPSLLDLPEVPPGDTIRLEQLPEETMAQLFPLLLPGMPDPPIELTEAAVARSNGNPASMREIAKLLLESGMVDTSTVPWKTDLSRLAMSDLPVSLEEALRARRQRLDERHRAILERAAVIGEVFWDEALLALGRDDAPPVEAIEPANIWPDDAELMTMEATLHRLEEAEFIIPLEGSDFLRVREYAFRHAGLRDQIYDEIGEDQLRHYHRLAAQWFDSGPASQRDQFLEQIADHWERAGQPERAATILIEAANVARSRFLNDKAILLYQKGLAHLTDQDRILRIEALHDLGSVHELVGDYDAALDCLTRMLYDAWVLVRRGKAGAALNKMGRLHRARGDYPAARAYLQRGLQLFRAADDTRGVASSLDDLGNLYWLMGHYLRALDHSAEALEIRRSRNDRRGESVSLLNIGHIEMARGYLNEADACYREALDISRAIGDRETECKALNAVGTVLHTRNENGAAVELWRGALKLAEDTGNQRLQSFLLNNLGEAFAEEGDRKNAERYLLESEKLAREREDRRVLAEVCRNLGMLMMHHNEVKRARKYLERSLDTAKAMGSKEAVGLALRALGVLRQKNLFFDKTPPKQGPAACFKEAIDIFERLGNEIELAHTLKALGSYWLEQNELNNAQPYLDRARELYERLDASKQMPLEPIGSGAWTVPDEAATAKPKEQGRPTKPQENHAAEPQSSPTQGDVKEK